MPDAGRRRPLRCILTNPLGIPGQEEDMCAVNAAERIQNGRMNFPAPEQKCFLMFHFMYICLAMTADEFTAYVL